MCERETCDIVHHRGVLYDVCVLYDVRVMCACCMMCPDLW